MASTAQVTAAGAEPVRQQVQPLTSFESSEAHVQGGGPARKVMVIDGESSHSQRMAVDGPDASERRTTRQEASGV